MTDEPRSGAHQAYVIQQLEHRLNNMSMQIEAVWKELRDEVRRGDSRGNSLNILDERFRDLRRSVDDINSAIRSELMSHDDFKPYKNGFIAVITTVGLAVLGALLKVVIIPK